MNIRILPILIVIALGAAVYLNSVLRPKPRPASADSVSVAAPRTEALRIQSDTTVPDAAVSENSAARAPAELETSKKSSLEARIAAFLKEKSGVEWTLNLDEKGRPFRFSGGSLPGIMAEGTAGSAFLSELQSILGFERPAQFVRTERRTARVRIVDQDQWIEIGGQRFRVFGGGIRFIGNGGDDAFMVVNNLRPVDSRIRTELTLSPEDALAIAAKDFDRAGFQYASDPAPTVVVADQAPHQLATSVVAAKGIDRRILLIGHESRSVVKVTPLTKR